MENKDKPAFPEPYINDPNLALSIMPGLTKREYFAAMAMNGLLYHSIYPTSEDAYAKKAISLADELLKQLEDGNNKS